MILKQHKGRDVVILDSTKYNEKMYDIIKYRTLQTTYNRSYYSRRTKDTKSFEKKNLNPQSQDTKDYTQQTQHQLDFMVQARYTY